MKRFFLSLLLISLSFPALDISGYVDQSGTATVKLTAELLPSEGHPISLNLSGDVDSVVVKDRSGLQLYPSINKTGNLTIISITVPYDYVEFDIQSDSFTSKNGSDWDFDLRFRPSEPLGPLYASIGFPKGTLIKSSNGGVEGSGDSVKVVWHAEGTGNWARLHAGYTIPLMEKNDDVPLIIAGILLVFAILVYLYLSRKKNLANQGPANPAPSACGHLDSNDVFKTLDETDKEIIREICQNGGKTTQARIYLNTHIPKATLSRRLASLEGKGLLVRSQKGNRNLVTLGPALAK
jgi:DNA-binding transcriptional ArsR family regulator